MAPAPESREYRYDEFVMAVYVCILLCSNLIGPAKETSIHVPLFGTVTFLAGVLFFSDLLHLRRYLDRGIWIRPGSPRRSPIESWRF